MAEKQINVPLSMCKKFMGAGNMRVPPEVTKKFESQLREWCDYKCQEATKKAQADKRKTLKVEDLEI